MIPCFRVVAVAIVSANSLLSPWQRDCVAVDAITRGETKRLPPVILLTVDDMNWDSVGVYGCKVEGPTPNIDELAGSSVRFENAYAQVSVCTPSRHVMLSGCYSHTTKSEGFVSLTPVCPTLPQILQDAGYYTAIINKGVGNYRWDFQADRKETNHGRDPSIYGKLVRRLYQEASQADRPLFLMANTMDPHRPFHGSKRQTQWSEISEIIPLLKTASRVYRPDEVTVPAFLPQLAPIRQEFAEYYSSVRRADDVVGAIVHELNELGIADEALIIFLSDHGMSMPFAKANVYRNSLRIPMMIKLPENRKSGTVVRGALVSTIDLAPTTLDLLSLPVPSQMQGSSLKRLLEGTADENADSRQYVFGYYYQGTTPGRTPMFTVQDKRFGYIVNLFHDTGRHAENSDFGQSPTWLSMVAQSKTSPEIRQRVNFHRNRTLEELYDYESDPHALNNLIDDSAYQTVRHRLVEELDQWMTRTRCDALDAFRARYDAAARAAYAQAEDAESLQRGDGNLSPVRFESESFELAEASWTTSENNGVCLVQPADGQTETVNMEGRSTVHSLRTRRDQQNTFIYFHVHDGFAAANQPDTSLSVRLRVFDKKPGSVLIQFNSVSSSYANSAARKLSGDGNWKTLEFILPHARFDNSQHDGADLRVTGKDNAEVYIEQLTIGTGSKTP